jgi:hypothetical protein
MLQKMAGHTMQLVAGAWNELCIVELRSEFVYLAKYYHMKFGGIRYVGMWEVKRYENVVQMRSENPDLDAIIIFREYWETRI